MMITITHDWNDTGWDRVLNAGAVRWNKLKSDKSKLIYQIQEYQPKWKTMGEQNIADLWSLFRFDSRVIDIQHIGSTSIPGMCAKPMIDIMIGVEKVGDILRIVSTLKHIGFKLVGFWGFRELNNYIGSNSVRNNLDDARMFLCASTYPTPECDVDYSIVVVVHKCLFWRSRVEFRDYARNNTHIREKYGKLKRQLFAKDITLFEYSSSKAKTFFHDSYLEIGFTPDEIATFNKNHEMTGFRNLNINYPQLTANGGFKCFSCL